MSSQLLVKINRSRKNISVSERVLWKIQKIFKRQKEGGTLCTEKLHFSFGKAALETSKSGLEMSLISLVVSGHFLMHCIVLTCGLQGTSAARLAGSPLALFSLHGWVANLGLQLPSFWSITMWYFMVVREAWAGFATAVLLGFMLGFWQFYP